MGNKQWLIDYWEKFGIVKDKRIIEAFKRIPREDFLPSEMISQAYNDHPLPIKCDQTISQPTTIIIMLEALELKKTDKVLEIGTGSGYNAALLSRLAKEVYTIEFHKELAYFAEQIIFRLGIRNVKIIHGDGGLGYKEEAPYDKIISTAAVPEIPKHWLMQLKEGGIIVAPVGNSYSQEMMKIKKTDGRLLNENLGDFRFVPMLGKHGF